MILYALDYYQHEDFSAVMASDIKVSRTLEAIGDGNLWLFDVTCLEQDMKWLLRDVNNEFGTQYSFRMGKKNIKVLGLKAGRQHEVGSLEINFRQSKEVPAGSTLADLSKPLANPWFTDRLYCERQMEYLGREVRGTFQHLDKPAPVPFVSTAMLIDQAHKRRLAQEAADAALLTRELEPEPETELTPDQRELARKEKERAYQRDYYQRNKPAIAKQKKKEARPMAEPKPKAEPRPKPEPKPRKANTGAPRSAEHMAKMREAAQAHYARKRAAKALVTPAQDDGPNYEVDEEPDNAAGPQDVFDQPEPNQHPKKRKRLGGDFQP